LGNYWAEIADKSSTQKQIAFIRGMLKKEGLVLDLACGTGRHSIPLSQGGYGIVGLDGSLTLLRIAKRRWSQLQVVLGDMQFLPFKPDVFSAAVSMDTSFGYLPSEQDDLQSLHELRRVLNSEGGFLLDVFNREYMVQTHSANRIQRFLSMFEQHALLWFFVPSGLVKWLSSFFKWKEYPSFLLLQKRTVNGKGEKLRDLWVICDKSSLLVKVFRHAVRLYPFERLRALLLKAGFLVSEVFGGYEGQSFSRDSKQLVIIASKASEI
jgi:ubiquinone/menaquinone biosynthesis C-methylase UbiE